MNLNNISVDETGHIMLDDSKLEIITGTAVIMLTDRFLVTAYPLKGDITAQELMANMLEMRIFDEDKECKIFRGSVNKSFKYRYLSDESCHDADYYDDCQYMDVDDKRSKDCENVRATGGGFYALPLVSFCDAKLRIRNYIKYDDCGQAYLWDWRLVEFYNEGGDSNGI